MEQCGLDGHLIVHFIKYSTAKELKKCVCMEIFYDIPYKHIGNIGLLCGSLPRGGYSQVY